MRLFLLLAFSAVDYYVLLVFFKEKSRQKLRASLIWLIGYFIFGLLAAKALLADDEPRSSVAYSLLSSLQVILTVSFGSQLLALMLNRLLDWHHEHNRANLHRQPIKAAIEGQGTINSISTYFYFFASLIILYGIWLGQPAT